MKKKGNLRPSERDRIAYMLAKGKSVGYIARALIRSKSTISDEIHRNSRWSTEKNNWVYEALFAQEETTKRMSERRKRPSLKNSWIYDYVVNISEEAGALNKLKEDLSSNMRVYMRRISDMKLSINTYLT